MTHAVNVPWRSLTCFVVTRLGLSLREDAFCHTARAQLG